MTPASAPDPLKPLRSRTWLAEARRKAIHLCAIVLPLALLEPHLPWPHTRAQWRWLLVVLTLGALVVDMVRVNDKRVRHLFRTVFAGMLREHEQWGLLGSTYLLIAALLAVEIFPRPIAAAALGFTVMGDAFAAMVGKAWGRRKLFHKSIEGALGGLGACLVWAAFLSTVHHVPWTVTLAGAVVASLVELLPIPLDDNLGITLISGYVMLWMRTG